MKTLQQQGVLKKTWGYELIWANTENYCGKILVFENKGAKTSMLFHNEKNKSWFINTGKFSVVWIDTKEGKTFHKELNEGETWHVAINQPHQLESLVDNSSITEVSTADIIEDYFRIFIPLDSNQA